MKEFLFKATPSAIAESNIVAFMTWLRVDKGLNFEDYPSLLTWSTQNTSDFWEYILSYFSIQYSGSYNQVLSGTMPAVKWFEGISLNYAEQIYSRAPTSGPVMVHFDEINSEARPIYHSDFFSKMKSLACALQSFGLEKGDRVAGYLPNVPEASLACLATISCGAIWSCCSLDFGVEAVVERFEQIQPKILFLSTAYSYNGKIYDKLEDAQAIIERLPSVKQVIFVPYIPSAHFPDNTISIQECFQYEHEHFSFNRVGFNDPIWILYSSGTTGKPKAITHSHGGMLLEHLKYLILQNDVRKGELFYWYSTTGWMMWNFAQASLLAGATVVIYEGSAAYKGLDFLWRKASEIGVHHFGTSAPFLVACMKNNIDTASLKIDLSNLRSIGSTGSPLPPEAFDYVYKHIKSDVWLCSMSGGTDVCTAFVGSNILSPVKKGCIQGRALGADIVALDDGGVPRLNEVGEMVVRKPMPCMPIYFWNDAKNERYKQSYFEEYNDYWRHGDWISIDDDGQITIFGRSDATLNRNGVRIGTAEIYNVLNDVEEIEDALIINLEQADGSSFMPLFIKIKENAILNDALKENIKQKLKVRCSPRHVPDEIFKVPDIPYTISGKKMEAPVKKILMGKEVSRAFSPDAMRNPKAMEFFVNFFKTVIESKS